MKTLVPIFEPGTIIVQIERTLYSGETTLNSIHVMMDWEVPLTEEHISHLSNATSGSYNILEIGFGLGISSGLIYNAFHNESGYNHCIYEINPVIAQNARDWAADKTDITIIESDWYDDVTNITASQYDMIFMDPFLDPHLTIFRNLVVDLCLKPGGIFTYYSIEGFDTYNYGNDVSITDVAVSPPPECEYFQGTIAKCPYYHKPLS